MAVRRRFFLLVHLLIISLIGGSLLPIGGDSARPTGRVEAAANGWETTGSLNTPRFNHTATLLPDGRVLVVGGAECCLPIESVEIYDPASGLWSEAAPLDEPREYHTATLLPDGRVLVVGGTSINDGTFADDTLASAVLYDSATDTWSDAGSMDTPRTGQTATLLADGRVLVAGGSDDRFSALDSAELYTPDTSGLSEGAWTSAGLMADPRWGHTAILLPTSGQVLVAGGMTDCGCIEDAAELYTPDTSGLTEGAWTSAGTMTVPRAFHTATILSDVFVLVAGGTEDGFFGLATTEVYSPGTNDWYETNPLQTARFLHTMTTLPNGQILVAGGIEEFVTLATAELFDPNTSLWEYTGSLQEERDSHTATLLSNGRVLAAGGYSENSSDGSLASAELYGDALPTPTPTVTTTPTPSNTSTPTSTPTNSATPTATATGTNTSTPTPTPSATPTSTLTPTQTGTPTSTPTGTLTPSATPTQTGTPTVTATATNTPIPSATPTSTSAPSATPTQTPVPTATPTLIPTATASATPTPTWTPIPTWTPTPTATITSTPVPGAPTSTATATPTPTATTPSADLRLSLSARGTGILPFADDYAEIRYTAAYTNNGPATAPSTFLQALIPVDTYLVRQSGWRAFAGGRIVQRSLGGLSAADSGTADLRIVPDVDVPYGTVISVTMQISSTVARVIDPAAGVATAAYVLQTGPVVTPVPTVGPGTPSPTPTQTPAPVATRVTLGPAGGELSAGGGAVTVWAPPGALATPIELTFEPLPKPAATGEFGYLSAFRLTARTPAGEPIDTFTQPLYLNVRLDPAAAFRFQAGSLTFVAGGPPDWSMVIPSGVDTARSTISARLTGSTSLAVRGVPAAGRVFLPLIAAGGAGW